MYSSFAVNKYLHTVASVGFLFTLNYDARNHELKILWFGLIRPFDFMNFPQLPALVIYVVIVHVMLFATNPPKINQYIFLYG